MTAPADFARKLDLILKSLSISRGRLAQESGLDKSLVGRWVAGNVRPSALNLERVTAALARRSPGFTMLDWDRPLDVFAERFGMTGPQSASLPEGALTFPMDILGPARAEIARRGDRYAGLYWIYRKSFGRPGKQGKLAVWIRPRDGLLEIWEGAPGFQYRGWALLMANRLYAMFTDDDAEVMAYMITNAGLPPKAQVLHAVFLGVSSDGQLTPKAAPCVLARVADLTGDPQADEATYTQMKANCGYIDPAEVPPAIRAFLDRDFGPTAFAMGGADMVTAPPPDEDEAG